MTWFERIAAAEERGFFLVRDYLAACDWKRCIASELHVTKNGDGMPVDPQLAQLTSEFPSYVYGGRASSVYGPSCIKLAFETFIAIQQRVAELTA